MYAYCVQKIWRTCNPWIDMATAFFSASHIVRALPKPVHVFPRAVCIFLPNVSNLQKAYDLRQKFCEWECGGIPFPFNMMTSDFGVVLPLCFPCWPSTQRRVAFFGPSPRLVGERRRRTTTGWVSVASSASEITPLDKRRDMAGQVTRSNCG